jgi:hypothetical protein
MTEDARRLFLRRCVGQLRPRLSSEALSRKARQLDTLVLPRTISVDVIPLMACGDVPSKPLEEKSAGSLPTASRPAGRLCLAVAGSFPANVRSGRNVASCAFPSPWNAGKRGLWRSAQPCRKLAASVRGAVGRARTWAGMQLCIGMRKGKRAPRAAPRKEEDWPSASEVTAVRLLSRAHGPGRQGRPNALGLLPRERTSNWAAEGRLGTRSGGGRSARGIGAGRSVLTGRVNQSDNHRRRRFGHDERS